MDFARDTPHTQQGLRYCAFISYRHTDKAWGDWLHKSLESYRVPRELVGSLGAHGPVPARLGRVFRDREELSAAQHLSEEIDRALRASENLVVVCSPAAAQSRWVNEEVLAWKRLRREKRLWAILVGGQPNATNPVQECFPSALKFEMGPDGALTEKRVEPFAPDARDDGDGKENAKLKVIAGILGIPYDELRRRHHEARVRAFRRFAAIVVSLALIFAGLAVAAGWFAWQSERQRDRAEANLNSAINAATSIILDIGDRFKNSQGMQRTTILGIHAQAQMLLDQLTQGQELTPLGRRARAVSLALSSQALEASGDRTAALRAAEEALLQMRGVADANQENAIFQRDVARCMEIVGDRRIVSGDTDGALSSYRAALAIYERLEASNPSDAGLEHSIAGLWQIIGSGLAINHDVPSALDAFQRSFAVLDRLSRDHPKAQQNETLKATTARGLADLQTKLGDVAAAEANYRSSVEIGRRLAAVDRGNVWYQGRLADSIRDLSIFLRRRGAFTEAISGLREAAQIDRRLYELDPQDVIAGGSLALTLWAEADVREAAGEEAGARTSYTEGIKLAEELIVKGRQDAKHKLLLASTLMKLGMLERRAGNAEAAQKPFQRAYDIASTVVPPDPLAPMAAKITGALSAQTVTKP